MKDFPLLSLIIVLSPKISVVFIFRTLVTPIQRHVTYTSATLIRKSRTRLVIGNTCVGVRGSSLQVTSALETLIPLTRKTS